MFSSSHTMRVSYQLRSNCTQVYNADGFFRLQVHLVEHEMNPDLVGSAEVVVRSVSPHPNSKSGREKVSPAHEVFCLRKHFDAPGNFHCETLQGWSPSPGVCPHCSTSRCLQPVLQCSYCTEICVGRDALDVHVETVHAGDKRNKCPICSAYFLTPDDFYW